MHMFQTREKNDHSYMCLGMNRKHCKECIEYGYKLYYLFYIDREVVEMICRESPVVSKLSKGMIAPIII